MPTIDEARAAELQQRYLRDQVETANPEQRLLMLINHLVVDISAAGEGFDKHDFKAVSDHLVNAQHIVLALQAPLAGSDWAGAEPLRTVYTFLYRRLLDANLQKDATLLPVCLEITRRILATNTTAIAQLVDERARSEEPTAVGG